MIEIAGHDGHPSTGSPRLAYGSEANIYTLIRAHNSLTVQCGVAENRA